MFEYFGKEIPTNLEELVRPSHTALVVVDVQNDFCVREGELACPEMVGKLKALIGSARRAGVMVVYIQDTLLSDRRSDSAAWIRHYMIALKTEDPTEVKETAVDGTWGHEIVDDVKPLTGEMVIKKYRSSAFYGTPLDMMLRSNMIKTAVITGVVTDGCVESTARSASNEYFVVIPEDCVWSGNEILHDACLTVMRNRYDLVMSEEIIQIWRDMGKH